MARALGILIGIIGGGVLVASPQGFHPNRPSIWCELEEFRLSSAILAHDTLAYGT
jgi:hypothetical protein